MNRAGYVQFRRKQQSGACFRSAKHIWWFKRIKIKENALIYLLLFQAGLYPIHLAMGGREGDVDDTIACLDLLLEFGADIDAQTKVNSHSNFRMRNFYRFVIIKIRA